MGNLLIIIGNILYYIIQGYSWILLGRIVLSWVNADPTNPIVLFLHRVTEPFLKRLRRQFPQLANMGGFDWTPMILFLALILAEYLLVMPLINWGESINAAN